MTKRELVSYKVTMTTDVVVYASDKDPMTTDDIRDTLYEQYRLQPAMDVIQHLVIETVTEEFREDVDE